MTTQQTQGKFYSDKTFWLSILFFLFIFLITRLPYYIYYPFAVIKGDSSSYFTVAFDLIGSGMPLLDQRTPGYPVFIIFVWVFSKNLICISLAQSILTLTASIFFLTVIYHTYKKFIFLFALALAIFISSSFYLLFEVTILTEAVFVNFLILSFGFLILALKKNKILYWILFSTSIGIINFIRPAGLFFMIILILLMVFFFMNKYKLKFYTALVLPAAIIILSLCIYNSFTLKSFSFLPVANLAGATILFMEPSSDYLPVVNHAINKVLDTIPAKEKSYVRESWGSAKLFNIFWNNYNRWMALVNYLRVQDTVFKYMDIQHIMRAISIDAIKKHPDAYIRFVYSNFVQFFRNLGSSANFYNELKIAYESTIFEKKYVRELEEVTWRPISSSRVLKDEVKQFYLEKINNENRSEYIIKLHNDKIEFRQTLLMGIYNAYETVYNFLFRNVIWIIFFIATFTLSIYKLIKSKFTNIDAFIVFLFGMILISKALLVSMVDSSTIRFSYTVEFVLFLSIPFFIILLNIPTTNIKQEENNLAKV